MDTEEQEISLDEIIQVMKKHWKMIIFPSFIIAVIFSIYFKLQPMLYDSFSLLKIGSVGNASFESVSAIKDIMQSFPMRQQIAEKLNKRDNLKFIREINSSIEYTDEGGLLKIHVDDNKPERAAEVVKAVTDIIIQRHEEMYLKAQDETDKVLLHVKMTVSPIPLSCGITEFKATKTEVVVQPFVNKETMPTKSKASVVIVFIGALFVTIIMSFILEGRKKQ